MADISKGKSPFYPGQPVPLELFVGRAEQVARILQRGAGQVAAGKPVAIFVRGEYGIGKSSFANYVQKAAEKQYGLHPITAALGRAHTIEEMAAAILEATLTSEAMEPSRTEKIKVWLARYIGQQSLFGININLQTLQQDAPNLATESGMLGFLRQTLERLEDDRVKGIFLILDEINGITTEPQFAQFLKTLWDANALSAKPIPILLMLCGVEERRRDMIQRHQPIDRILDVVDIEPMRQEEMQEFFERAFSSVDISVAPKAMALLTHYSGGLPKIMHIIGDSAYWINQDEVIDLRDANMAVSMAADEVGKKFVEQQIYNALRSSDYRSILGKVADSAFDSIDSIRFTRAEIARKLTSDEKKKFDNFLQRMIGLNVFHCGDVRGEYVFNLRLVLHYIWLQSQSN